MKVLLFLVCIFFLQNAGIGQPCGIGQTPTSAFPVCGTKTFKQTVVPLCAGTNMPVTGCGSGYSDKNPYYYKFTCYTTGTLAFDIVPVNSGDDYDWQLFDITDKDPNNIFTDASMIVIGNWAGTYGNTGASAAGSAAIECGSDPAANHNTYSKMPTLTQGHEYLLMISHFTDSQIGYSLTFGSAGTAVITDPLIPALKTAEPDCAGLVIRTKLNKKIRCNTFTTGGSEFYVMPGNIPAVSAVAIGCDAGFDADSIEVTLSRTLAPGSYELHIKNGGDGNTLADYCDNYIADTGKVTFKVLDRKPTEMDSLEKVTCSPKVLHLVFKKAISCASVAADGSDFNLTGSYPVTIAGAAGGCSGTATKSKDVFITLAQPLQTAGAFRLTLKRGLDGNTIIDECGEEAPVTSLFFSVKDTVNADFTYVKKYGCTVDTVQFIHFGANGVSRWNWNLDEAKTSILQSPKALYSVFNTKRIALAVSNGFCTDTSQGSVELTNSMQAAISVFDELCPNEETAFTGTAQGIGLGHHWDFGDGGMANIQSPAHAYTAPVLNTTYTVRYTITDSIGCQVTAQKKVNVYNNCYVAVPNAFTPNGDGRNDFLYPLNAVKADGLDFRVFNRWGQLIFQTNYWKRGWDGRVAGQPQPTGTYVWFLRYTDRDSKVVRELKGTATLIR